MKKIFITATDTDAGKTHIARAIVNGLVAQGNKVCVFKPISAGCDVINGELVNDDAAKLLIQSNCHQSLSQVNPIAFEPPIAPHIAAKMLNQEISIEQLIANYHSIGNDSANIILTEGAGGWRLPLGNGRYLSEFVKQSKQHVVLVVNMKLGCLNHALLTYEAIQSDELSCIGWVANCQEKMDYLDENIAELTQLFPMPLLGTVMFEPNIEKVAQQLDLSVLQSN